jgi:hypothetical protein
VVPQHRGFCSATNVPRSVGQERSERAVDQPRWFIEGEVAHVAFAKIEVHARFGRPGTGLLEHHWRRVNADHSLSRRLSDWNRDPPIADRKLDQSAVM